MRRNNDEPIGFRLEGNIASDGGEVTLYEVDKSLSYGEQVLAFCYVREKKRFLRKSKYQTRIDVRHRAETIGNSEVLCERRTLDRATEDVFNFIVDATEKIDPQRDRSIEVKPRGEGLIEREFEKAYEERLDRLSNTIDVWHNLAIRNQPRRQFYQESQ